MSTTSSPGRGGRAPPPGRAGGAVVDDEVDVHLSLGRSRRAHRVRADRVAPLGRQGPPLAVPVRARGAVDQPAAGQREEHLDPLVEPAGGELVEVGAPEGDPDEARGQPLGAHGGGGEGPVRRHGLDGRDGHRRSPSSLRTMIDVRLSLTSLSRGRPRVEIEENPRMRVRGTLAALAALTVLVGCGSTDAGEGDGGAAASGDGAFPVSIEHTFGTTTVEQQPERVVVLGWSAQDVVYALGVTPVGMPSYTYGGGDDGALPGDDEYYDAAKTPPLDPAEGPPLEDIAALRPDVILATYEGFDEATYDDLSRIAPTVAYPGEAWTTP